VVLILVPPLDAVYHPLRVYAIVVAAVDVAEDGDTVPLFALNVTVYVATPDPLLRVAVGNAPIAP
jgi:hypothetical protein